MVSETMYALGSKRSCIRELFEYGLRQAKAVGKENVFDFSIGNPSIPSPPEVNEAFVSIVRDRDSLSVHGYTTAGGSDEARAAVAADLNARYDAHIKPQNLFFTCGAAPALIAAIRALAVEGAEIMAIAPYFAEYRPFVEANGPKFVAVPADREAFQIRFDELEARITSHTQGIIVNSPCNPSGVVYTQETLERLGEILTRKSQEYGHPIYILADEPYRELSYDGAEPPFIPNIYPSTIVCYSYSKSLSLPGERIGYVCVPDQAEDSQRVYAAVAGAARVLGHVCAPSLQQLVVAKCAAVRPDLKAYDRNRTALYEALTEYGYHCAKPTGAFYMFVQAPGGDAQAFSDRAKEKNLLVVPGGDFGCPDYFRVSTCVDYDMIQRSLPVFKELIETA
ncbi:pyridoxal phosphate-dependent aminotransferase [Oscillibacter sp. 1-3]|uniref:pyridoxal phosphate-dependent aminotransferase n=1 Tax=Oscillibacter sp. 1-3 TaxID=1235797 RepID=UPI00033FB3A9|nr:pyridoxal phosphate-dependent aminotransferase [Oscillibacter sp. 1-3]EOS65708.1 aspartate aminotransferase [Oscillibacter sp. 1-3]MCI9511725.1 pyridoxal phosphate-dependent aminotransferase [Oscillibacter sp.]